MNNTQNVEMLSDKFLSYLRAELGNPAVDFAAPLAQLHGGYETAIYHFELDGVPDELSRPLVLRLYPQFYGTGNAIWESTVQNALIEAGYPVAQAHLVCTDMSILGGAFFIMDHLPGQPLAVAPYDSMTRLLGETHAALHEIDPTPLVKTLADIGIPQQNYGFNSRLDWLCDKTRKHPWIHKAVDWLFDYRPTEPERLSICHGDFHPFNMMVDADKITGVLDWGGLALADPAYDVGNTLVLLTFPSKHLPALMGDFAPDEFDLMADLYLAAYRKHRHLDDTTLDYYRIRRCVRALVEGVEGHKVWQHPLIVRDMVAVILQITGVQVTMPT
jgi:aminoglycoside phosphotransferase (APT) family kinase protein